MPARLGVVTFRLGEALCYAAGVILSGFFLVQLAQGEVQRQGGIAEFERLAQADTTGSGAETSAAVAPSAEPDFEEMTGAPDTSLWAPGRIADYEASLEATLPPVMGVLEVPSVNLKVPVYQTASDLVMDRGAGVIDGMSYPHEPGNIGISGHRDGYFRALKDVAVGDTIYVIKANDICY